MWEERCQLSNKIFSVTRKRIFSQWLDILLKAVFVGILDTLFVHKIHISEPLFLCRFKEKTLGSAVEREEKTVVETIVLKPKNGDGVAKRERDILQGIVLTTTLERIEKVFFITNPRLPDNPIVSKVFRFFLVSLSI